jgi:hypothetical protein
MLRSTLEWIVSLGSGVPTMSEARRDPWRRLNLEPPLRAYGPGAVVEFHEYLRRESRISVDTPEQAAEWLLTCRYASDQELLDEADAWLHPSTLELVRCGDCEDFALWGWRKLVELGMDADFVVGMRTDHERRPVRHAWVTYRHDGAEWMFEAVERSLARMFQPLDEVRELYVPQVGVARDASRHAYAGLFATDWGRKIRF